MADTTFVDGDLSLANRIVAAWLNDVNKLRYGASSAARGAALLQFIQAGTGATVRDAQTKGREQVSVKDFGALGDGSTNDTANIAKGIAAVLAAGGPALYFPPGTYNYTGLTIADGSSNLELRGDRGGLPILAYTPATGDGITFAGQANNFTARNLSMTSPNSSTGAAFKSNQLSTQPLRNHLYDGVYISGFKSAHVHGGALNWRVLGPCNWTGQGKGVAAGYGFAIGSDATHSFNQLLFDSGIYLSSYQIGLYNINGAQVIWDGGILGTCQYLIRNASGQMYVRAYMEDDNNAPDAIGVLGEGGYTYLEPLRTSLITAANLISDVSHRTHIAGGNPTRVSAYRSAGYSLNGGPTKLPYDTAIENTDTWFSTTNSDVTIANTGFYRVTAPVNFTATGAAQIITAVLYNNGAGVTQSEVNAQSSVAGSFGMTLMWELWLTAGDVIDIRATTSANLALRSAGITVSNLGT